MSGYRKSRWSGALVGVLALFGVILLAGIQSAGAHDEPRGRPHHKGIPANPTAVMRAFMNDAQPAQSQLAVESNVPCTDGFAGEYPCHGVDLLAFMPLAAIGGDHIGSAGNDIWGWTDPVTGREYALAGRVFAMSVVDITDPLNPLYLGQLFAHDNTGSSWRDIKVYDDHAFVVSQASGHGIQVFDLRQLKNFDPAGAPYNFVETAHYGGFGSAHNIVINEATAYAYGVGVNATSPNTCDDGLHIVDIIDPANPVFAGCFDADGYTHDAQCVLYGGPDPDYQGREICFAANEDTITIVDVTNKASPQQISRTGYLGRGYTHQAWLSEDHEYLLLDDELDEINFGHPTKTRVWDVSDLDAPLLIDEFVNVTDAIDHNLYVKGDLVFQANYRAGLAVLHILRDGGGAYAGLDEVGYFDIYPANDNPNFNAAWSTYPYFPSGVVVVNGIEQGLFVLALNLPDEVAFVSPAAGANVSGNAVAIEIFARDGDLSAATPTVQWRVDGGALQAAAFSGTGDLFTASWDTTGLLDGAHSLSAVMTDAANNLTMTTIGVTVSNNDDPPSVAITEPSDGTTVTGKVTLKATASDDGTVMGVAFYDDGNMIGNAAFSGGLWSLGWQTKKLAETDHLVSARATDDGGQWTEASITVTVGGGGGNPGGGGGNPGGGNGKPDGGGGSTKCHPKKDLNCER